MRAPTWIFRAVSTLGVVAALVLIGADLSGMIHAGSHPSDSASSAFSTPSDIDWP